MMTMMTMMTMTSGTASTASASDGSPAIADSAGAGAQLFWHDEDDEWVLIYRDGVGANRVARLVAASVDASIEELAQFVECEIELNSATTADLTVTIWVYRADAQRGRIEVVDGEVDSWRAL